MKAATYGNKTIKRINNISIHAAREGGDGCKFAVTITKGRFQSTPPVKAATISDKIHVTFTVISIHAAREGGDHADKTNFYRI